MTFVKKKNCFSISLSLSLFSSVLFRISRKSHKNVKIDCIAVQKSQKNLTIGLFIVLKSLLNVI